MTNTHDMRYLLLVDLLNQADQERNALTQTDMLCRAMRDLDSLLGASVALARECGATWESVGKAAGCSRQAAWVRWAGKA